MSEGVPVLDEIGTQRHATLALLGWQFEHYTLPGRWLIYSPAGEYIGFEYSLAYAVDRVWETRHRPDQAMWTGRSLEEFNG